jgi:hypothetical protein
LLTFVTLLFSSGHRRCISLNPENLLLTRALARIWSLVARGTFGTSRS